MACCKSLILVVARAIFFRHELECPQPTGQRFEDFMLSHFKGVIDKFERNR